MSIIPTKALHPGVSVSQALKHLGMSQKNLADRSDLSEKTISMIINGETSLTVETAIKFENVLGGSAEFWSNLESNYRTSLLRKQQLHQAEAELSLARSFPYNELVKRNLVPKTFDKKDRVKHLWKFFGVDSLAKVPSFERAAYRRGIISTDDTKAGSLAAWLRCGEIAYSKSLALSISTFDASKLKDLFPFIRESTKMKNEDFFSELQNNLALAGVGLVAVQYFPGTKASGAMRWIGSNPVIQLSTYGKDADKVWFTLFHELGHILLHRKKNQYISFTHTSSTSEEIEADNFARDHLISQSAYSKFISNLGCTIKSNIQLFADREGIDPGIVVGRMKKDKVLDYTDHHSLHKKLLIKDSN